MTRHQEAGSQAHRLQDAWAAGYAAAMRDAGQVLRRSIPPGQRREDALDLLAAAGIGGVYSAPPASEIRKWAA